MNIVLTTPPVVPGITDYSTDAFPPLGLLYVAADLRDSLFADVTILDPSCEGLNVTETLHRVLAHEPDLVGITSTSRNFSSAWKLIIEVKKARPNALTLLGGIHATLFGDFIP